MNKIEALKAELAELEANASLKTDTQDSASVPTGESLLDAERAELIADDDPELAPYMADRKFPEISSRLTLAEAKAALADSRTNNRLYATVRDGSKLMDVRVAAAKQLLGRLPEGNYLSHLKQLSSEEMVERLMLHPHAAKLKELHAFIYDRSPVTDIGAFVSERSEAIAKFRSLQNEYPRRNIDTPVLTDPEQSVAYHAAAQDPKHGVVRDTYRYALGLLGFKS